MPECKRRAPVRALAEGDVVPAQSSRPAAQERAEETLPATAVQTDGLGAEQRARHDLPSDFLARVRLLPAQTMLRIPAQFRETLCALTAELLEGSNAGDQSMAVLEQARSKLLLGHLPAGCSAPLEMRTRIDLWQRGCFLELLERMEGQYKAAKATNGTRRTRGQRARAMARSGAYRKAVASLSTSAADLTPDEQIRWANLLLPIRNSSATAGPDHPQRAPPLDVPESQEVPRPLDGVHFGRLSGPEPSGMRPEHLRDMLGCKRRRPVNRLLRALHSTEVLAATGSLPPCWRWMLASRLVFIAKKRGNTPRPIRVGEVWRRVVAKHALHKHSAKVRQQMLAAHQYGVSIPGGAETLVHARRLLEDVLRYDAATGVWAVVDIDFVNAFPSLEWDAIDAATAELLPEIAAWTKWCHEAPADIDLPSGACHRADRGAEQGDPLRSMQCGVVIACLVRSAIAEMSTRKGTPLPECFSFWYCDDGQVVCRPADVGLFLECLDTVAARVGATRGEGCDVKSHVRLVGHPDALAAFGDDTWATDRVRSTCKLGAPNGDCEVLGAVVGTPAAMEAQFKERIAKLHDLHSALSEINDPATKLTLGRVCGGVSRCTHDLRAAGGHLNENLLQAYDTELDNFVGQTLGGDLHERALAQAALGVPQGGLGFRRASGLALPAFVASRTESRPFVEYLFHSMEAAGIAVAGAITLYDKETDDAWQSFKALLSHDRGSLAESFRENACSAASKVFEAVQTGARLGSPGAPVGTGQAGDFVVPALGSDDPEHPASSCSKRPRLQRQLATLFDKECADATFASGDRDVDGRRLAELSHDSVSSEWLWALDPVQRECVESDAYVAAVRLRLGATFASKPLRCNICNATLDVHGVHATCCAPGESTRGHNGVRDAVFDLARLADPTAEKETLGLLDSAPGLRPADILTSAVSPGYVSSLDIGVAAVEARHAGNDCTEAMRLRKRAVYRPHLPALESEGIAYRPLVWSCWGRGHPDTTAALTALARQAARRRGLQSHAGLLRSTRAQVGAALARRSAAMLRSCFPGE